MILITTSRRPTRSMRTLCKEFNRVLPNTVRINRGKLSISGVAEKAVVHNADKVIIIERYMGGPGKILFYKIVFNELKQLSPQIYLKNLKTQDELGRRMSLKENLSITMPKNSSIELKKLASSLSGFLNIPSINEASSELTSKASIHLTSAQNFEAKISFTKPPMVNEIGPILFVKYISWQTNKGELEKNIDYQKSQYDNKD